jgi:O-antigen ligase
MLPANYSWYNSMSLTNSTLAPATHAWCQYPVNRCRWAGGGLSRSIAAVFAQCASLPTVLWLGLWFGVNTGPWVLRQMPATTVGWVHLARTVFPFIGLVAAVSLLGKRGGGRLWARMGPARLWLVYGVVSLAAGVFSPTLSSAIYWSVMYLAVLPILLLWLDEQDPLGSVVRLNRFNFLVATLFLMAMMVVARDALFVGSGLETSAYGVIGRAETIEGAPVSRSSGFARFGGVVGILSLVYLWQMRSWKRTLWVIPFLLATAFLYTLQSRGAIVAYAVSIILLLGLRSFESRRVLAVPVAILLGLAVFADRIPFDRIKEHITRGEGIEQLETLGGRTSTWERARPVIYRSPIWGYGMQADRYLLEGYEHAHNTYLYALLTSGILGTAAFVGGLVWAWAILFRAVKSTVLTRSPPPPFLYEALGILTFFTVRSISEVSGPMFGVDYMLMLPVMVYLGLLRHRRVPRIRAGGRIPCNGLQP